MATEGLLVNCGRKIHSSEGTKHADVGDRRNQVLPSKDRDIERVKGSVEDECISIIDGRKRWRQEGKCVLWMETNDERASE